MKAEDFIREVKESGLAPVKFDEIYADFQRYQRMAMEMLKHFHSICEENDIHYQIGFGTLLGAIRDGGQIPWDYDIDVFVPYKERQKLIEVLREKLDSKYYIEGPEVNPRCPRSLTRIGYVGYSTDELHVDIFYYIGAESKEKKDKLAKQLANIQYIRYSKYVKLKECHYGNKKLFFLLLLRKLKYFFVSGKSLLKEYDVLCEKHKNIELPFLLLTGGFSVKYTYTQEQLTNTMLYQTDNGVFRVPIEYDAILKEQYGGDKYKQYYPLENRLGEMMINYAKLAKYSSKKYLRNTKA